MKDLFDQLAVPVQVRQVPIYCSDDSDALNLKRFNLPKQDWTNDRVIVALSMPLLTYGTSKTANGKNTPSTAQLANMFLTLQEAVTGRLLFENMSLTYLTDANLLDRIRRFEKPLYVDWNSSYITYQGADFADAASIPTVPLDVYSITKPEAEDILALLRAKQELAKTYVNLF